MTSEPAYGSPEGNPISPRYREQHQPVPDTPRDKAHSEVRGEVRLVAMRFVPSEQGGFWTPAVATPDTWDENSVWADAWGAGIDSAEYAHMRAFIRDDDGWMHLHLGCGDECPAKTLPPKLAILDSTFKDS